MADLVFLVLVVIAILIGMKVGFIKGLVNLITAFVAAIGGYLLYPYVAGFIIKTPLFGAISKPINSYIVKNYLEGKPIENLNSLFIKYGTNTIEDLFSKISDGITTVIINLISIILVFILIKSLLRLVKGLTAFIAKLPVIRSVDKILGMLTSVFTLVLIIHLITAVMLIPPCNSSELSKKMCDYIDNSIITKEVMDYNIFINYKSLSEMGDM